MYTQKKTFVCPHNKEIDCDQAHCESCGWYPPVAEERKREIMALKLYKVPFTGCCDVWAKSSEEAEEKAMTLEPQFVAYIDFDEPICTKEEKHELVG